jgi:hypothetical protein
VTLRSFTRWALASFGQPVLLALLAGFVLRQTTGLSMHAVWFDALVVGHVALFLGLLGASIRRVTVRRRFFLLSGFLLHSFVIGAEAGSWVARRHWGMNLSGNVVVDFLPHVVELGRLLSWRSLVLLSLWFVASWLLARSWAWALENAHVRIALPRQALLMLLCAGSLFFWARGASESGAAEDPIFSLLRLQDFPALPPTPARMAAWVHDEELRRTFDAGESNRRNIILILSDGVRPDRLPMYGYHRPTMPFLDSLSKSTGWAQVPCAYSAATESLGGIGSIVSGRATRTMSARSYGIVEFFAREGYRTHLLLNGVHSWYELRTMYGSKLTTFRDLRHMSWDIPLHDDRQIVEWMKELPDAGGDPSFVMLFLMGTHEIAPLTAEETIYSREDPGIEAFAATPPGPAELAQGSERYDDQLAATDKRLAQIWSLLEQKGYLRNSFVLFSSDHGQMLGEHRGFGHGEYLWEEAIRVPMAVWSDGALPKINTQRTAWTPDVAPTLAQAAGLKPLPGWEGLSLFDPAERNVFGTESVWHTLHVRAVFHETAGHRWKLHQEKDEDGKLVREKLFDVLADPTESRDLLAEASPELLAGLRSLLASDEALPVTR